MNLKQQQFLDNLQKTTEGGAVQPDELILAIEALLAVLNNFKSELEDKIVDTGAESASVINRVKETVAGLERDFKKSAGSSEEKFLTQIKDLSKRLSDEVARIERIIPTVPDLTSIEEKISEVEAKIPVLKDQIFDTPQEIRDNLEKLKNDERLDISAIKGIGKRLSKLSDDIINRAIGILDQRTSFLINKVSNLQAQIGTGTGGGGSALTVKDIDGTPTATNINTIRFTNGSVTDDGGGQVTVTTGTGGGGDVSSNTATSVDSEVALFSGTGGKTIQRATGTGIATLTAGVLSATTTTGSGSVVLATSPTLVAPVLGTPASGVATNLTGTASGLTAGNVTTNANLTGEITSVGNAAVLGSFTSLALKTALTDETGSGAAVFATSPTLVTPLLGTPTSGVMTNVTGTAAGLTAGTVTTNANLTGDVTSVGNATTLTNAPVIAKVLTGYTSGAGTVAATDSILQAIQKLNGNDATNANLTGPITSVGNATSIASQTGTGTKFVVDTSPTLITPVLGVATATSINKVAITAPATSATLTIADGKTLSTVNFTTTGGDASMVGSGSAVTTFPSTAENTTLPGSVGRDRKTGQTAAVNLATYTVGASDATYLVSANVLVTTSTVHAFTVTCSYTDEGNTARVLTLQFSSLAGAFVTSIANAAGTVPYEGAPLHIRCKASTTIIIGSAAGGTYTTVAYNIEGRILLVN